MKRKIIEIDEDKCNGCGLCVPDCPEGALQIIDGKARLVSDLFCDGLGACIGNCPEGAIEVVEREAEAYDEGKVMKNIVPKGEATIRAHLKHLKGHGADQYYSEAIDYLKKNNIELSGSDNDGAEPHICPGLKSVDLRPAEKAVVSGNTLSGKAELENWPVQMHLANPSSPHFKKSDLLLAADCTAFAAGNFHSDFLKGKKLVIACPKLDNSSEIYKNRIMDFIENAEINTLTVLRMQVPCCGGLTAVAKEAAESVSRKIPVKEIVISIEGMILSEKWL